MYLVAANAVFNPLYTINIANAVYICTNLIVQVSRV